MANNPWDSMAAAEREATKDSPPEFARYRKNFSSTSTEIPDEALAMNAEFDARALDAWAARRTVVREAGSRVRAAVAERMRHNGLSEHPGAGDLLYVIDATIREMEVEF